MNVFVALLGEVLGTEATLEGLDFLVNQEVVLKPALPRELLPTVPVLAEQNLSSASRARVEHLELVVTRGLFY